MAVYEVQATDSLKIKKFIQTNIHLTCSHLSCTQILHSANHTNILSANHTNITIYSSQQSTKFNTNLQERMSCSIGRPEAKLPTRISALAMGTFSDDFT